MRKIILGILIAGISFPALAQKLKQPPHPRPLHPRTSPPGAPPPILLPDSDKYHEVEGEIKEVIREFKTIDDSATGRISVNDTVNRDMKGSFPTVCVIAKVEFAGRPDDNHTRHTFIKDYRIGARAVYDNEKKKNKYTDSRYTFDYKNQTITNLSTEKSGKKKAYNMDFALLNLSADGTLKIMTVDERAQSNSIQETNEMEDISGYQCRKYVKTDPTGKTEIWMTTDKTIDRPGMQDAMMKAFFGSTASIPNSYVDYKSVLKGVPVRMAFFPQHQPFAQKCTITYQKIEQGVTDESVFSTEGYEVKKLNTLFEVMKSYKD
ncbi:MAG: DUF4412 domain-containing protein [Bacteroidetes bacterium]|nr:DUF4412 domain-containing protein [Bacteroidota bacterium]